MKLIRVGVDLAKNVFQVHGVDRNEKAVWRRKLARESWIKVLLETAAPSCEIGWRRAVVLITGPVYCRCTDSKCG